MRWEQQYYQSLCRTCNLKGEGMSYLYDISYGLKKGRNYIYGDDEHALHIGKYFEGRGFPFEGFCTLNKSHEWLLGKKVISIDEFNKINNANLLLTRNRWQCIYDELYCLVEESRIFINTTWLREDKLCIMCNNPVTFSGNAHFVPFLTDRMFSGKEKQTDIIHCPRCRAYYSSYRPSDDEMDLFYEGYRDEFYQRTREKYEPTYTKKFNEYLFAPSDGGKSRRSNITKFLSPLIEKTVIKTVLDFGGDKGQFIPTCFENADRFVYEISGNEVVEGVTLLTDKSDLKLHQWDLILCNMVMEHLSDVQAYFKELVSCMSSNTLLYIEVPNERYMEDSEFVLIHEHINFFREETFYYLGKMNDLEILKTSKTGDIRVLFKKKGNPMS